MHIHGLWPSKCPSPKLVYCHNANQLPNINEHHRNKEFWLLIVTNTIMYYQLKIDETP